MSHSITIQEGALLISDAHYAPTLRPQLLSFFQALNAQKIQTTQLLLFGDIFDALFGYIPYTYAQNKELVDLLNKLSLEIEIIYLEGNHDFQLQQFFPNIRVFSIEEQPLTCKYKNKEGFIAHGDFNGAFGYKLYTKLIRNKYLLQILKQIDDRIEHAIIHKIDAHLGKKEDCQEFRGFEAFIKEHISSYKEGDFFIEGHFHQNKTLEFDTLQYINLGAFACNQRYFRVKSSQDNQLKLQELQFKTGDENNG